VENRQVVLPAVELVVRVRRVGGGDPPWSEYQPSGLAIARVETLRHQVGTASQASERRTTSSAEAAGAAWRQTWHRRGCPMTELVQIVAGLSQAARDGARQRASILD
jgi:hypothetical protein